MKAKKFGAVAMALAMAGTMVPMSAGRRDPRL